MHRILSDLYDFHGVDACLLLDGINHAAVEDLVSLVYKGEIQQSDSHRRRDLLQLLSDFQMGVSSDKSELTFFHLVQQRTRHDSDVAVSEELKPDPDATEELHIPSDMLPDRGATEKISRRRTKDSSRNRRRNVDGTSQSTKSNDSTKNVSARSKGSSWKRKRSSSNNQYTDLVDGPQTENVYKNNAADYVEPPPLPNSVINQIEAIDSEDVKPSDLSWNGGNSSECIFVADATTSPENAQYQAQGQLNTRTQVLSSRQHSNTTEEPAIGAKKKRKMSQNERDHVARKQLRSKQRKNSHEENGALHRCRICPRKFSTPEKLVEHKVSYHAYPTNQEPSLVCSLCQVMQKSWDGLLEHRKKKHKLITYSCHHCGKLFRWRNNFHRHIDTHRSEKRFKCEMCESSFVNKERLDQHVKAVHLGITYTCQVK